jgi:hypothetical protein
MPSPRMFWQLDLRFTNVLAGWEESTHDALILTGANQRSNGLKDLEGNNTG